MNVNRTMFVAVKEESESVFLEYRWHEVTLANEHRGWKMEDVGQIFGKIAAENLKLET